MTSKATMDTTDNPDPQTRKVRPLRLTRSPLHHLGGRPRRRMPAGWIGAEGIAPAVGYGARWVRRHLGHLAARLNKRDYRWRVEDVNAWLRSNGLPPLPEDLFIR